MAFTSDPSVIDVPVSEDELPVINAAQAGLPTPSEAFLDDLLGPREMAAWLKMSIGGFYNAVKRQQLPTPINYGKGPRWSKAAMLAFIYGKAQEQAQAAQKH
jgi:predicted DNA-binding transcriptional regulator AlpA